MRSRSHTTSIRAVAARAVVFALALLVATAAHAEDPAPIDEPPSIEGTATVNATAQEAYVVLARSCSPCHSETMRRPKGGFGFVLDLPRLARAGEYVVRGRPEASSLWRSIEDGSMPPARSSQFVLTDEDRAAVLTWIAAGAPPGPIDPSTLPTVPELEEVSDAAHYVGQLHPLLLHFPIGLLVAAALAEIVFLLRNEPRFRSAAEYCLLLGTFGSCAATVSGWFFASDLGYQLTAHRWLGVATSLFALAACRAASRVRRLPPPDAPLVTYRVALAATILLLVITSHLGGTTTWSDSMFAP